MVLCISSVVAFVRSSSPRATVRRRLWRQTNKADLRKVSAKRSFKGRRWAMVRVRRGSANVSSTVHHTRSCYGSTVYGVLSKVPTCFATSHRLQGAPGLHPAAVRRRAHQNQPLPHHPSSLPPLVRALAALVEGAHGLVRASYLNLHEVRHPVVALRARRGRLVHVLPRAVAAQHVVHLLPLNLDGVPDGLGYVVDVGAGLAVELETAAVGAVVHQQHVRAVRTEAEHGVRACRHLRRTRLLWRRGPIVNFLPKYGCF